MKLLIDENLSERLVSSLADCFESVEHVRAVGLRGGKDSDIWDRAQEHGLAILTKDMDFEARSILYGAPPKVILVRLGNCTTKNVEIVVRNSLEAIGFFEKDVASSLLLIP